MSQLREKNIEKILNSEFIDSSAKDKARKTIEYIIEETSLDPKKSTLPIIISIPLLSHPLLLKNAPEEQKKPILKSIKSEVQQYQKTTFNILTRQVLPHLTGIGTNNKSHPLTSDQLIQLVNRTVRNYFENISENLENALKNKHIYKDMPEFYQLTDSANNIYLFAPNIKNLKRAIEKTEKKREEVLERISCLPEANNIIEHEKKILKLEDDISKYKIEDKIKLLELEFIKKLVNLYSRYDFSLPNELTGNLKKSIFSILLPRDFFRCMIINLKPENECLGWFKKLDDIYPLKINTLKLLMKDPYYNNKNRKNKSKPQGLQLQFISYELSPKPIEIYLLSLNDFIKYFFTEAAHRIYEIRRKQKNNY